MASGFSSEQLHAQLPRLRRYARALTHSREAADDLTQDTLERAWSKRALWSDSGDATRPTSLRAWLHAVMHNVFINSTRKRRPDESLDDLPDSAEALREEGASAETRVALRDMQRALVRLPDEQREVVLLVGLEQLSYAETADALGVPIGTVMSRLSRGRERLRQMLEDPDAQSRASGLRRVK